MRRLWAGLAIALAACGGDPTIDDRVTISGVVTDAETSAPLAGASITTEPETIDVTTDADGRYAITGVRRNLVLQITAAEFGATLVDELKAVFEAFPGESEVMLEMQTRDGLRRLRFGDGYRVRPSAALHAELDALLGAGARAA